MPDQSLATDEPSTMTAEEYANLHPQVSSADDLTAGATKYTTSTLNIRSSPFTTASKLGSYSCGAQVITSKSQSGTISGWTEVIYNGKLGYCLSKFLASKKSVAAPVKKVTGSMLKSSKQTPDAPEPKTAAEIAETTVTDYTWPIIGGVAVVGLGLIALMVHVHNKHVAEQTAHAA